MPEPEFDQERWVYLVQEVGGFEVLEIEDLPNLEELFALSTY